jgi:hypothetical protein
MGAAIVGNQHTNVVMTANLTRMSATGSFFVSNINAFLSCSPMVFNILNMGFNWKKWMYTRQHHASTCFVTL